VPGRGLGEVEGGAQVDLYDALPIVLAKLQRRSAADYTGVVDQYVEAPERANAFFYDIGGELRVCFEQIRVHGVEAATLVPDKVSGLFQRHDVKGGDVRSGFGEARGDAPP
jgi:hypothetical protein